MVCKLNKSLYGLKQTTHCWFAKLSIALKHYEFQQSLSNYSLFVLQRPGVDIVVLVYVDDQIILGDNHIHEAITEFKAYLHNCIHTKDLGILKYFLGVEVARSSAGIFLCQHKYALDIIAKAGLLGAKPSNVAIEQNHCLALAADLPFPRPNQYMWLVGHLIYLCFTRPKLSYCVHLLSQFMQAPKGAHWEAVLHVV